MHRCVQKLRIQGKIGRMNPVKTEWSMLLALSGKIVAVCECREPMIVYWRGNIRNNVIVNPL